MTKDFVKAWNTENERICKIINHPRGKHELKEIVCELKAREAAEINKKGCTSQMEYIENTYCHRFIRSQIIGLIEKRLKLRAQTFKRKGVR